MPPNTAREGDPRSPGVVGDVARSFLDRQRVAYLATVDQRGVPHVVPVCFALVDRSIYVAIDEKPKRSAPTRLKRLRNIAANPHVALVADRYDDADWSRLGWVMVRGPAQIITQGTEHARALEALRAKYPQYKTMALERRPVVAMLMERVVTWGNLHC